MVNQSPIEETNMLGACLQPLLKTLRWHGSEKRLHEAMPYFSQIDSALSFCYVMYNLGYSYDKIHTSLTKIDARLLPALFVGNDGKTVVLVEHKPPVLTAFDGNTGKPKVYNLNDPALRKIKGTLYSFKLKTKEQLVKPQNETIYSLFTIHRRLIIAVLAFSFILNILALAVPLFIMAIYNRVIAAASPYMLGEFLVGMVIITLTSSYLMRIRAKLLSSLGAKLNLQIGSRIFQRLLFLPIGFTESANISAQIARLKDFNRVRELFSGSLLTMFFDLPFIIISIIVIAILSAWLALIPVAMVFIFILSGIIILRKLRLTMRKAGNSGSEYQDFLVETIQQLRAIKYTSTEELWEKRYAGFCAQSIVTNLKLKILDSFTSTFADAIMLLAGLGILAFGAMMVIQQTLSIGAMIAIMILVWRVLSPLRSLFNLLPKLQQLYSSGQQINRLMALTPEITYEAEDLVKDAKKLKGNIVFDNVSMRYPQAQNPCLFGINFEMKTGQHLGVVGPNASGKSTLLKLLLKLYPVQGGKIFIDGLDIRQFNPLELRQSIAYLPQQPQIFYGTVASNLRLNNPTADDELLHNVAKQIGILPDILQLPDGFETWLTDNSIHKLSAGFLQGLCLMRTLLKPADIILLDEPANNLDDKADQLFINFIKSLHGRKTLIMISHRPSHLRLMDMILAIDKGHAVLFGPATEVLEKIPKGLL